jgi:hypothetical protein
MQSKKIIAGLASSALILSFLAPVFQASASDGLGISVGSSSSTRVSAATRNMPKMIVRADQEIARRIAGLTALSNRVDGMKNVSAADKANISTQVNAEIASLTALKTKIDADTDSAVLKTDVKSITDSYRIYALIMPQFSIFAAADRISTISDAMASTSVKLAVRITAAQTAGKNVTSLQASLTDLNAKTADAKVQAAAAISLVTGLMPDGGDKAKAATNRQALVDARAKIKAGTGDLQTARKDANVIMRGLKTFNLEVKATSTVEAH